MSSRLVLAVAITACLRTVHAAPHPAVSLKVDPCVAIAPAELRRFLALELPARIVDRPSPETTLATIGCEGAATTLRVDDPLTGKALLRTIDLSADTGVARGRLLAVAISELISASWTELESTPRVAPVGASVPPDTRAAALAAAQRRPRFRHELDAIGSGRGWFGGAGFLGGGGVRYSGRFPYHLGFTLDVIGSGGRVSTALGVVFIEDVSGAAFLVARQDWARVTLEVGGGLRLGGVHLSGKADSSGNTVAGDGWGTWLGPAASIGVSVEPVRRLHLGLFGEVGYTLLPVYGIVGGVGTVSIDGVWLGVQLAVGILL